MTTGELWPSLYKGDADNIRKWLYGSVLIRDWKADGSTALDDFTPFADDGNIRDDLFSDTLPGGRFYEVGALTEDGVSFTPKFTVEQTKIWQSRQSQRSDTTEDDEEVKFTLSESTPLADYLRLNKPLVNVPEVGTTGYSVDKSNFSDTLYRQIVVIGVDGSLTDGNSQYIAEIRPRVSLSKVGARDFQAKKVDMVELTFDVFPDPHSGFPARTKRGGPVWGLDGGEIELPTVSTVTATPVTGLKANLVFAEPVSDNDPFTYTVQKTTGGTTTAATIVGTPTTDPDGTVHIVVGSLTAATAYTFTVTAEGSNDATAAYPASASVTAIA